MFQQSIRKGSFKAVTTTTAVKQDLIISAYKPNGGLEDRFAANPNSEESAWDFVRTHLSYLPTVKVRAGELEFIVERDPRIIFDRMVAWFVRHNTPVPMSSHEFQSGLMQRFVERDGMVFCLTRLLSTTRSAAKSMATKPRRARLIKVERSIVRMSASAKKWP